MTAGATESCHVEQTRSALQKSRHRNSGPAGLVLFINIFICAFLFDHKIGPSSKRFAKKKRTPTLVEFPESFFYAQFEEFMVVFVVLGGQIGTLGPSAVHAFPL